MTTLLLTLAFVAPVQPFAITMVDDQTGRGVPLVELTTTNSIRYFTDSAGVIAFDEPGLMNTDVHFTVTVHGYEYPKDGFGIRGVRLTTKPGGSATVKVKRVNIAERLYRLTGDGIYAESEKAGLKVPFDPTPKGVKVLGCDSVAVAAYQKKLFWIWGDTNRAAYPLGNFNTTAATSAGDPEIDRGIRFDYFGDGKGFVKGIAPMPGKGPTWVEALFVVPDASGREWLWAEFVKVEGLKPYARGLAVFDDDKKEFVKKLDLPHDGPVLPIGHAFKHGEHLYFGNPFPHVRIPATEAALLDPSKYEAYTCVKSGSTLAKPEFDRDADGKPRYQWRTNAPHISPEKQADWVKKGLLKAGEGPVPLTDRASGQFITMHRGSVNWNPYRKKWVMIANQIGGKPSNLGEVWYAEADEPGGPWREAVKIVTHDRMDFYNPKHHPMFDRDGGKTIYFEGTYTNTFSGNPDRTPRYEYNQILYKLDLSDERLHKK
jgi:hypothetical protein